MTDITSCRNVIRSNKVLVLCLLFFWLFFAKGRKNNDDILIKCIPIKNKECTSILTGTLNWYQFS